MEGGRSHLVCFRLQLCPHIGQLSLEVAECSVVCRGRYTARRARRGGGARGGTHRAVRRQRRARVVALARQAACTILQCRHLAADRGMNRRYNTKAL